MAIVNYIIKLLLSAFRFDALAGFAQTIHDGFVAQVATYATPNPLMTAFQDDIDALNAAIAAWGPPHAHGSRAQHTALVNAANQVRLDLRMLAAYAMNETPNDTTSWGLVGFPFRAAKTPPAVLGPAQNLRVVIDNNVLGAYRTIDWKKPLAAPASAAKSYCIVVTNQIVVPPAVSSDGHAVISADGAKMYFTTKSRYVILPPFSGDNVLYVIPFNGAGFGTVSDPLVFQGPAKV